MWVGEWVQWGDVSRESQASPMESIPKIFLCIYVRILVLLIQIYRHFRSQAAGSPAPLG